MGAAAPTPDPGETDAADGVNEEDFGLLASETGGKGANTGEDA